MNMFRFAVSLQESQEAQLLKPSVPTLPRMATSSRLHNHWYTTGKQADTLKSKI